MHDANLDRARLLALRRNGWTCADIAAALETTPEQVRAALQGMPLAEIGFSSRVYNALRSRGIHTVDDLLAFWDTPPGPYDGERDGRQRVRGVGTQGAAEIAAAVARWRRS
jgi:hypothetical protein